MKRKRVVITDRDLNSRRKDEKRGRVGGGGGRGLPGGWRRQLNIEEREEKGKQKMVTLVAYWYGLSSKYKNKKNK